MEIKSSRQISKESVSYKTFLIWKNVDINKKWVAVDDLIKFIEDYDDPESFNEYQIRKRTLINKLNSLSNEKGKE